MLNIYKGTGIIVVCTFMLGFSALSAEAQGKKNKDVVKDVVVKELNQKTKLVGTFDLYEESTKQVRNLRMISVEDPIEDKNGLRVPVKFRDAASGDLVTVEAQTQQVNGTLKVVEWAITNVETLEKAATKESYTDEEVTKVINDYLEQQTKFTDHLLLFDPKIENMRKLELIGLKGELRSFGILTIETATFKDLDRGETLTVDIHVKNKEGVLEVESLKIKKVGKAKPVPESERTL